MRRAVFVGLCLSLLAVGASRTASAQIRWPSQSARDRDALADRAVDLGASLSFGASLPEHWLPQGAVLVQGPQPTRQEMRRMAAQHLERALLLRPGDAHAHSLAAEAWEQLRDFPRAEHHARRALELDPRGPDAASMWFVLAMVHTFGGDHAAARDAYLSQLTFPLRDSLAAVVWSNLAETYVSLRQLPEAVEAFTRAVALDDSYALAWLGLALTRDRLGATPWPDAVRAHEAASAQQQSQRRRRFLPPPPGLDFDALTQSLTGDGVFFLPVYDRHAYAAISLEGAARALRQGPHRRDDPGRAIAYAREALVAWETYLREASADDPWRDQATRRARSLREALP